MSYSWHEDQKRVEWVIEQKQTQGASFVSQDGATTKLFHLPVTLELTLESGEKISQKVEVGEIKERIFMNVSQKPVMVRFDPGFTIPKTLKFPRSKEMLLYQLTRDSDCMGRVEAAKELVKIADHSIVEKLIEAFRTEAFWGVQAEIAAALAEIKTDFARDGLIAALSTAHPKARRAVVNSLSGFRDEEVSKALKKLAERDPSYFVEADSTFAWAASQLKSSLPLSSPIFQAVESFLTQKLDHESYREVIRTAALKGLGELGGLGAIGRAETVQKLIEWTRRGKPNDARVAAVRALGKVMSFAPTPERSRILSLLNELADEDSFRLRSQLVQALEESAAAEAIPILRKIHQNEWDGRVKRAALIAIDNILSGAALPESVTGLKVALEKLEEDYKKLRSAVEEREFRSHTT